MKKTLLAALWLLFSFPALAQTTSTVTGTIKNLSGVAVTSGAVTFTLQPGIDTTISGSARFVPSTVTCGINGSGLVKNQALSGACTVTYNTSLTPIGTFYKVCLLPVFVKTSCFNTYITADVDITTVVPTPDTSPAYTFVDQTSNQSAIGGNKTFTGTVTFSGAVSALSFEGEIYADQYSGADIGAKVNAAIAATTANHTITVPAGTYSFSTPIVITKQIKLKLGGGVYTYSGSGTALSVSAAIPGVVIEGAGHGITTDQGTTLYCSNTAANGVDVLDSMGSVLMDFAIKGPSSGTGIGLQYTANNGTLSGLRVSNFGSDGVQINGTRANSNNLNIQRVRSDNNGGNGFYAFGTNGNVIQFLGTDASSNALNYKIATFSNTFVGAHTEAASGAIGVSFISGGYGNYGTIYSEPVAPETTAVSFASGANFNHIILLNGSAVSDSGTGNQYELIASSNTIGDQGRPLFQWFSALTNDTINPVLNISRANSLAELTKVGIYSKTADAHSGFTITTAAAFNLVYRTGAGGGGFNIYNAAADGALDTATPVVGIDSSGNATFSTSVISPSFLASGTVSSTGTFRLGDTSTIKYRNNANGADLNGLSKNTSDVFQVGDAAGVKIATSSSAAITSHLSATATIDFAAQAANTCTDSSGITVTGAADGDTVTVGAPAADWVANANYTAYVSASNTVKVRLCNSATSASADPASGTFRVDVWRH